jgi:hypothetical protein
MRNEYDGGVIGTFSTAVCDGDDSHNNKVGTKFGVASLVSARFWHK